MLMGSVSTDLDRGVVGASTWAARYLAAANDCGRAFETLDELLADPEVDVVYISPDRRGN
jgi:predicted dehydrogenase